MSYSRVKINQYGDPATVLSFETATGIPTPAENEIVIQVTASAIYPFDFACIKGVRHDGVTTPEFTSPGSEGVGHIRAVGKNVTEFTVGQRVSFFSYTGAWSEYLVMKAPFEFVVPVPDTLPDSAAGQFPINQLTMYGLFDDSNASPDDWILQTAAGSVLGQMAIEFAKVKKLKMINVVRRKEQVEQLKARYGAETQVVVFDGSNEVEALAEVNAITSNKGINIVFEAVGSTTFEFALKALAPRGRLLSYGAMSGNYNMQVSFGILISKSPRIEGFAVTEWLARKSPAEKKRIIDELIDLMVSKKIVPALQSVYRLEDFKEAIAKTTTPGKLGRIFLAAHPEKVTK